MKQPSRLRNALWFLLPLMGVLFFLSYSTTFASIQVVATSSLTYGHYCGGSVEQALPVGTAANRIAFVTFIDSHFHGDVVDVKYHSQNFTLLDTVAAGGYSYDFYYLLDPITTGSSDNVHVDFTGSGGCSDLKLDAISYSGVAQLAPASHTYANVGSATQTFTATSSDVSLLMALEYGGGSPTISSPTYSLQNRYEASVSTFDFGNGTSSLSNGTNSFTHTTGGSNDWIYQAIFEPATLSASGLQQYHADGTSVIGEGDTTTENQVVFGAQLHSNATSSLQLQVEVESAGSNNFTGTANVTSTPVSPEGNATATFTGSNGSYHWQARVWDATNSTSSPWQIFASSTTSTDFTINYVPAGSIELVATSSLLYGNYCGPFQDQPLAVGTSSNRIAFVTLVDSNFHSDVVSVRYHSQDFTLLDSVVAGGYSYDFYYLLNPTMTGSGDNVRVNFGNGTSCSNLKLDAISYSGVAQVTPTYYAYPNVGNGTETFATSAGDTSLIMALEYGGGSPTITSPSYSLRNRYEASVSTFDYGNDGSALGNGTSSFTHTTGGSNDWIYQAVFAPASGMQESYYGQVENGTRNLRAASSTSSSVLKTLPADWAIYIESSTDSSGDAMVNGSDTWYKVMDPTDGVIGWMVASDTTTQYISSYDGSAQAALEASSSDVLSTSSTRAEAIVDAVQNYYTNSSTVSSLDTDEYADSSANLSDIFNLSNATSVPPVLFYGMAAQESGGIGFDNTNIKPFYPAYGYGIMQLTTLSTSSDVYNLQVLLNKNSSTQVEASGPGSPGNETHDFTSDVTAAVETFQSENSIASTGNVFFLTRSALNALLPTSSIPTDFRFNTNMSQGDDDRLNSTSSPLGKVSGVVVPPCSDLQDPSDANYYQDCLGESSTSTPNQYYAPQANYGNQTFEWYGNTVQSIYSNIKDALGVMRTKWYAWAPCTYGDLSFGAPGFATTTFTCNDRLNILSVWGYNGFTTSSYLADVADQLNGENIQNTFPTADIPTSTSAEWYNKLEIGQANEFQFEQDSPVDSAVVDSEGRVTGVVNGKLEIQIPDSAYDTRTHSGVVLFPQDTYTFRVQGDATGTYGFTVQLNDHSPTSTIFHVDNFPTSPGAIHEYSIDFKKLERGEPGVAVDINNKGNGKIDKVLTDVGTVSIGPAQTYPAPILTPPIIPQRPAPAPKLPVRIIESAPLIPTSTNTFASSTFLSVASTTLTSSSPANFTSTLEIASSTIQTNSSTENNE